MGGQKKKEENKKKRVAQIRLYIYFFITFDLNTL